MDRRILLHTARSIAVSRASFPADRLQITKDVIFLKVPFHQSARLDLIVDERAHFGTSHTTDFRNTRFRALPLFFVNILSWWL